MLDLYASITKDGVSQSGKPCPKLDELVFIASSPKTFHTLGGIDSVNVDVGSLLIEFNVDIPLEI